MIIYMKHNKRSLDRLVKDLSLGEVVRLLDSGLQYEDLALVFDDVLNPSKAKREVGFSVGYLWYIYPGKHLNLGNPFSSKGYEILSKWYGLGYTKHYGTGTELANDLELSHTRISELILSFRKLLSLNHNGSASRLRRDIFYRCLDRMK